MFLKVSKAPSTGKDINHRNLMITIFVAVFNNWPGDFWNISLTEKLVSSSALKLSRSGDNTVSFALSLAIRPYRPSQFSRKSDTHTHTHTHTHTYIYIYIYVLFGPVKPELGVIPSGQENHSGAEHLNFPGRELNPLDLKKSCYIFLCVFGSHQKRKTGWK